ncbi:flavin reductase family protein [Pinisolibacter sp.]|uniref:flavin reductase family protein n=1 Tax=Pinisolibacter sp. TaxID=2172024 RepID=UPI002FDD9EAD
MFYAVADGLPGLAIDPFKAIVAPRPIAWISTIDATGRVNLAPYSYFNAVCAAPPMVMFSSDGWKDTVAACAETREFVVNLASFDLRDAMNESSAPLPRGVSEFDHVGLTREASRLVRPPRVGEAAASLECRVTEILNPKTVGGRATGNHVVFGEVVGVHIRDDCMIDGRFDMVRAGTIGRCGYSDFFHVTELFRMPRPKGGGNGA